MIDPRLTQLIQSHLDGQLSSEEQQELNRWLCDSESARQQFWELSAIHGALHEVLKTEPAIVTSISESERANHISFQRNWFQGSLLTAVIIGLLVGLGGASLVYACVMPRLVATSERLIALIDGSFEQTQGPIAAGFPSQFGAWSGDAAEIVFENVSREGKQTLRFVRAAGNPNVPNSRARSCDVYQLVDLRSLRTDSLHGEATLEMTANFLDARAASKMPVTFTCRIYAFSGSPESLQQEWPLTRMESLAMGASEWHSKGGSPDTWHSVTAKLLLPAQADFAVVQLVAGKPPIGNDDRIAEFGQQYVDDVRLTLKKNPTLPVRVVPTE